MIPALLQLDKDMQTYLDNLLEVGTENDYVTLEYLVKIYPKENHHIDQITNRIRSYLQSHGKHIYRIVLSEENPEEEFCMACGEGTKLGYVDAYQFLKFKSGTKCPYNYSDNCCRDCFI
jgi:hypothetical protein